MWKLVVVSLQKLRFFFGFCSFSRFRQVILASLLVQCGLVLSLQFSFLTKRKENGQKGKKHFYAKPLHFFVPSVGYSIEDILLLYEWSKSGGVKHQDVFKAKVFMGGYSADFINIVYSNVHNYRNQNVNVGNLTTSIRNVKVTLYLAW